MAEEHKLHAQVLTPEGEVFDGEVEQLSTRTSVGRGRHQRQPRPAVGSPGARGAAPARVRGRDRALRRRPRAGSRSSLTRRGCSSARRSRPTSSTRPISRALDEAERAQRGRGGLRRRGAPSARSAREAFIADRRGLYRAHVLVTGGTGFLEGALSSSFPCFERGHNVRDHGPQPRPRGRCALGGRTPRGPKSTTAGSKSWPPT